MSDRSRNAPAKPFTPPCAFSHFFRCAAAWIALGAAFAAHAQRGEAPAVDVLAYEAEIEPMIAARSLSGRVTVRLRAGEGARELWLDAGDLAIDSVVEAGTSRAFAKDGERLRVDLGAGKAPRERAIEIAYHGAPRRGLAFIPGSLQVTATFSTSHWLPSVAAPSERAELDLTLIVPSDLTVAASGVHDGDRPVDGGRIASRWRLTQPLPSYLYGFAVGRFSAAVAQAGRVELELLGPASRSAQDLERIFAETAAMLEFFEGRAGVRYPFRGYAQALVENGGAQEMGALAVMGDGYGTRVLADPRNVWLGAHELAHQWWGNGVTNESWSHFWLNEGIGTFMAAAFLEHRFGRDAYLEQIDSARAKYKALRAAGKDHALVYADWTRPTAEDRSIVYDKGAYVVHLLREDIGEDAFWSGLRAYTVAHWGESVTTSDFQAAMEQAAGRDLAQFFATWVYAPAP